MGFISNMNRSLELDEKAKERSSKAYEISERANQQRSEKEAQVEKALNKLINRKKAIISTSMKDFVDEFQQLMKVNVTEGEGMKELAGILPTVMLEEMKSIQITALNPQNQGNDFSLYLLGTLKDTALGLGTVTVGSIVAKGIASHSVKTFVSTELAAIVSGPIGIAIAAGTAVTGLSKSIVQDSEREYKSARNLLSQAEAYKEQNEIVMVAMDAIIKRADMISDLLAKLNLLFIKNLTVIKELTTQKGYDARNYSREERENLMVCANLAKTVKEIIDTPLLDKEGNLAQTAIQAIEKGQQYFDAMNQLR